MRLLSSTSTERPDLARALASTDPTTPHPTTTQSYRTVDASCTAVGQLRAHCRVRIKSSPPRPLPLRAKGCASWRRPVRLLKLALKLWIGEALGRETRLLSSVGVFKGYKTESCVAGWGRSRAGEVVSSGSTRPAAEQAEVRFRSPSSNGFDATFTPTTAPNDAGSVSGQLDRRARAGQGRGQRCARCPRRRERELTPVGVTASALLGTVLFQRILGNVRPRSVEVCGVTFVRTLNRRTGTRRRRRASC